jgi:predicted component of type VI protein secretion system
MPRCSKGTRKNKLTGVCENKNTSKKKKLELKLKLCLDDLEKFKKYKNAREQKKYFKLIDTRNDLENKIENLDTDKKLTEEEVENIITPYKLDKKDKDEIKEKLMNLTYDNKYISCFTGKKTVNLYSMANDKLSCFLKYGNEI